MSRRTRPHRRSTRVHYDEALGLAMGLHREARADEAEPIYRQLIAARPADPNPKHFLGMLLVQRGRPTDRAEGERLIVESAQADPSVAAWQNNLGNILLEAGRHEEAAQAFRRCNELDPDDPAAWNNLGCLLRELGHLDESQAAFRRSLELDEPKAPVHLNYARLLRSQGKIREALEHATRALELQPTNPQVRAVLGRMYATTGQRDKAAAVFRDWLAQEPDNPHARHHLAAVTGEDVPPRACDAYVVSVFDNFAATFDHRLAGLGYQAPRLVGEALDRRLGPGQTGLDIVDAGAGTGLCGPWLRPHARHLTGVDLSAGMLERARARGGYDHLEQAELAAWLAAHPASCDAIVSADTLCYFGTLADVTGRAFAALRPGGVLVFTVEAHDGEDDHRLESHGRYSHGRGYLQRTLAGHGFIDIDIDAVALRAEAGETVKGWLATACRPRTDGHD